MLNILNISYKSFLSTSVNLTTRLHLDVNIILSLKFNFLEQVNFQITNAHFDIDNKFNIPSSIVFVCHRFT